MEQLNLLAWTEPEPDRIEQRVTIVCADIEDVDLSEFGPFDALFSDPPYGLTPGKNAKKGFMGLAWDKGVPGPAIWAHLAQFLRPGANVAAFGGPRTCHRLACAIEDAGLEIRDRIWAWAYGSGWPKPANVAKYIDNHLINPEWKKARIGRRGRGLGKRGPGGKRAAWYKKAQKARFWTRRATSEARAFEGYHGNLKPAVEPLVLARKPLDGTLAQNALEHGVAGLNVDGCRIGASGRPLREATGGKSRPNAYADDTSGGSKAIGKTDLGRWPTNFVLTCPCADSTEHLPGCHVRALDEQSGPSRSSRGKPRSSKKPGGVGFSTTHTGAEYEDSGGSSRFFKAIPVDLKSQFFYCAKVSRKERAGLKHPTMKPLRLTEYYARLLLQPPTRERVLMVPCSGVCSEAIGAVRAGWGRVVGIERDPEYCRQGAERIERETGIKVERIGFE